MTLFKFEAGLFIILLLSTAGPAAGVIISTPFQDALSSGGTPVTLPFLVEQSAPNRNVYLRFSNPLFDQIVSVNSIEVTVHLYDDDDGASESNNVLFAVRALDGPDVFLGLVLPTQLQGTTSGSPFVFNHSLTLPEIEDVLPTLTDNAAFRVRVQRDGGDLFVRDGTVVIDANLRALAVPEPGTLACLGAGLGWLAWSRRRRKIG
jgi:hypothetical protein